MRFRNYRNGFTIVPRTKKKGIQLESERLNVFHNSLSASYYYAANIRTFG